MVQPDYNNDYKQGEAMKKLLLALLICSLFVIPSFAASTDLFSAWNEDDNEIRITKAGLLVGMKTSYEVFFLTGDTLTAAESGKTVIYDRGGIVLAAGLVPPIVLPPAAVGLEFTIVSGGAQITRVKPGSSDRIKYSTCATADSIRSSGNTVADSVTVICGTGNTWYVSAMKGAWTDSN